ncbi:MAG: methylenetetrahydrofolate reductase C-terminal domain-containing protein [Candidatus Scalindua sp.]|nr:methylenetetrahydrofolate reductase C-terminal domain-containing protein [Candidatus Scalindua sp.]
MIVAESKLFEEINKLVKGYSKVSVIGCGDCVTVCHSGGQKQVEELALKLRIAAKREGRKLEVKEDTVLRQCEQEYVEPVGDYIKDCDAVISIACGIGVQTLVEKFPPARVIPGLNTTFMGAPVQPGLFLERCAGCGECVLDETGGFCPVSRCSKSLLNGPCGGSMGGKCEVAQDIPCVWHQIYDQLDKQGRLDCMDEIKPPKRWSVSTGSAPRKLEIKHLQGG